MRVLQSHELTYGGTTLQYQPMQLRPANDDDAKQIADIWNHYIRETIATFNPVEKTSSEIKSMLTEKRRNNLPFIVADDTKITGFATYGDFRSGLGYAKTQEHTILLHPEALGNGIGSGLIAALEKNAKSAGIQSLIAGVSGENTLAIDFHIACGFKQVARLNQVGFKFDRWHDLVFLQKVL